MQYRISCWAKINEFLAVGRPDHRDYHPIETVFQEISLADELVVTTGETAVDQVEFTKASSLAFEKENVPHINTVTKTLMLLRTQATMPPFRIEVIKRIPSQSGLGGASADAAGVLRMVQALVPDAFTNERLLELGLMIGADVPFCFTGGRALGTGYGEVLRPLPDTPIRWLVVARPFEHGSTPKMFTALDRKVRDIVTYRGDLGYNDFEQVTGPESLWLIERMRSLGSVQAGLSGSGSAVFGFFTGQKAAQWAAGKLMEDNVPFVQVAHTMPKRKSVMDGIARTDAIQEIVAPF